MTSVLQELTSHCVTTPDGPFTIIEAERMDGTTAVVASGWSADVASVLHQARLKDTHVVPGSKSAAADAVNAYYQGDVTAIESIPVQQQGTQFQQAVWQQLRRIPAGEPLTYSQLAQTLDRPRAFRAVASSCARNANALFVPCHRVVARNGSLAGFAWGTDTKSRLLQREADRG